MDVVRVVDSLYYGRALHFIDAQRLSTSHVIH